MSIRFPDDLLLPPDTAPAPTPVRPARMLAFVPIAVALAGVGAILVGGLTVHGGATAVTRSGTVTDPITTASIPPKPAADAPLAQKPKDIEQILEMLDK